MQSARKPKPQPATPPRCPKAPAVARGRNHRFGPMELGLARSWRTGVHEGRSKIQDPRSREDPNSKIQSEGRIREFLVLVPGKLLECGCPKASPGRAPRTRE